MRAACGTRAAPVPSFLTHDTDASSGEQLVDRLNQPRNVDVHCVPQNAMIDQVVAVDEVISCARDVLSGDILAALLEFVW
jgi:hypothetical protein